MPQLLYAKDMRSGKPERLHQKIEAAAATPPDERPRANTLIIPSMALDQPVLEGRNTYAVLDKGILRWPASSTPDKGGNTVLAGHRFTYTNPRGVFYQLDKVKQGDEIGLVWNQKVYTYSIDSIRTVQPTETSILDNTEDARLTLFTCTPLWSPKERLVVTATLRTTKEN